MADKLQFNWSKWRNRSVWYKGKKIKLRHYIRINALLMQQANKPGWHRVDHYLNYKIALSRYGLKGIKYYESRFYKGKPMPYNRSLWRQFWTAVSEFFLAEKQLFKKLFKR